MFAHILILTDLSPQSRASVPLVKALAQALGARITLLHALEGRAPEGVIAALQHEADVLQKEGFSAQVQLIEGSVEQALEGLRGHPALVAVGRTGASGLERVLLGSNTLRVLRASPVPVLVAGASPAQGLRHILCPVDLRDDAPQAIAEAASIAIAADAQLTLLHTLSPDSERSPDEALASLQRRAAQALDPALVDRLRLRCEVGFAEVEAEAIAALSTRAELVVMASHGRSGLAGLLLGSVAEAVIERSAAAVLVVHPL